MVYTRLSIRDNQAKRDSIRNPIKLQRLKNIKPLVSLTYQTYNKIMALKYKLIDHVSLTSVDSDMVLLDMHEGKYYGLNNVGAQFLNLIQKNTEIDDAIMQIADSFTTDYNQVRIDIHDLIKQLIDKNLLESINE